MAGPLIIEKEIMVVKAEWYDGYKVVLSTTRERDWIVLEMTTTAAKALLEKLKEKLEDK